MTPAGSAWLHLHLSTGTEKTQQYQPVLIRREGDSVVEFTGSVWPGICHTDKLFIPEVALCLLA